MSANNALGPGPRIAIGLLCLAAGLIPMLAAFDIGPLNSRDINADPVELSIPYAAISRSRPSATPLLNYLIVWDHEGHPDSFVVDAANV